LNLIGRDDKANLPLDRCYNKKQLLQLRYIKKGAEYSQTAYDLAVKADTHDYHGAEGRKLVMSTSLLQHRSTQGCIRSAEFESAQPPPPYTVDYDVGAVHERDGQVGGFQGTVRPGVCKIVRASREFQA
jgi:hypothetical protein